MSFDRVVNQLKICHKYRFNFDMMLEDMEFYLHNFRFYSIRGHYYFYQLGTERNYSITSRV